MADPAASGADPLSPRLNAGFEAELDQLRLQVEVMGVRVDQNLELMREFLRTGRQGLADQAVVSDAVLGELTAKLYEARYRALSADIMGNTYEQYLGKTLVQVGGAVVTAGGRVLCVTALGDNVKAAQKRAYEVLDQISFDGMQCRRDIGYRAIKR